MQIMYLYFAICSSTEESRRLCGLIPSEHNLRADLLSVPTSTLGKYTVKWDFNFFVIILFQGDILEVRY